MQVQQQIAPALAALLDKVIDYAGLFPPAKLPLQTALQNYSIYSQSDYAFMLSRFVASQAEAQSIPSPRPPLSLLTDDSTTDLAQKAQAIESNTVINQAASQPKPVYCEVQLTDLTHLDAVKAAGNYAKVRTGGLKPEAIPSPEDVARFIIACADRSLAFKATAGLHHPIRKEQALTYESDSPRAIMHGFINVLMAAAFAYHGEKDLKVIAAIIDEREPSAFRFDHKAWWSDRCLTADQVKDARKHFVHSIGSCSFQEPVEDLQALGLLPLV